MQKGKRSGFVNRLVVGWLEVGVEVEPPSRLRFGLKAATFGARENLQLWNFNFYEL